MSHSDICHQIVSQGITNHESHPKKSFCREYWSCETFDQVQRQPFYQEMLFNNVLSFGFEKKEEIGYLRIWDSDGDISIMVMKIQVMNHKLWSTQNVI